MIESGQNREQGFTIVELLIAMAMTGIILGSMFTFLIGQRKYLAVQEQVTEMVQSMRAAMDLMTREIRMAGYDPSGNASAGIVAATADSFRFTMDITDRATPPGPPDGRVDGPNEDITYSLYISEGIQKIGRKTGALGRNEPLVENVQTLTFVYRGADGNVTITPANIRQVQITIMARTAKPDPDYSTNNGYRTYTLTSSINLRNLAY